MKPRVLICTPYLGINGAEVNLANLVNRLSKIYDLIVVSGYDGPVSERLDPSVRQYHIHEISRGFIWKVRKRMQGRDQEETILQRIHDRFKPDFWYINASVFPLFLRTAIHLKMPVILHAHELSDRLAQMDPDYISLLTSYPSRILCSSELCSNTFRSMGAQHVQVLYPGVDYGRFEEVDAQREAGLWISCGNPDTNKNPHLFIRTAQKALAENNALKFVWIGGDTESDAIENLSEEVQLMGLADKISFVGWQTDAYASFYKRAEGYLCTSTQESFGITVLEAAYNGLNIVSTRCGGPEEIFGDQIKYGKDGTELANHILSVKTPPDTLKDRAIEFSVERAVICLSSEWDRFYNNLRADG